MAGIIALWDLDDDPEGNVMHIAEHGIAPIEVDEVLNNPIGHDISESSGRPLIFGYTAAGRLLVVVYEEIDEDYVYPVTAYELEES
jgi:hypothetical protein